MQENKKNETVKPESDSEKFIINERNINDSIQHTDKRPREEKPKK